MAYNKETGMYEGWIYKISNNINLKCYIGQTTTSIKRRWSQHLNSKSSDSILYKAMNKYGRDNFDIEEIEFIENKSKEELKKLLNEKEKYYIFTNNTIIPYGYNMTAGGESRPDNVCIKVYCYTIDGKYIGEFKSMTEASMNLDIPITNIHEALSRKGTTHGYYFSFEQCFDYKPLTGVKVAVDVYDYKTLSYVGQFESISSALCYLGFDNKRVSHVKRCMDGKTKHAYGYIWRYAGESINDRRCIKSLSLMKPINIYNTNDEYIATYPSITLAADQYGIYRSAISACLSKKQKSTRGYKFYYADDLNQPDKTKITDASPVDIIDEYEYVVQNMSNGKKEVKYA